MNTKQIVILVGVIFIAFVGYKIIASNIQENKEKEVLRERAQLQELAKEPLNKCISDIDKQTDIKIKDDYELFYRMATTEFQSACQKSNSVDYCKPPTIQEFNEKIQEYRDQAEKEKDACYKRYK